MGFGGNYAPRGLSPQMYDMPVIQKKSANRMTFIQLALSSLVTPEGF